MSHPLQVRGLKPFFGRIGGDALNVAPFTGAWIETIDHQANSHEWTRSHPLQVRGLKRGIATDIEHAGIVAPFTGAWIETSLYVRVTK